MLSVLLILILIYFYFTGARRGLRLQLLYMAGYLISLFIAAVSCGAFGAAIDLWVPYPSATEQSNFTFFTAGVGLTLDKAFYRAVAFMIVLALGWLLTRVVVLWFHDWVYADGVTQTTQITAGALNVMIGYVFLFLMLYTLGLIPVASIQQMLAHSFVARAIVRYSLGLTNLFTWLWLIA